MDISFREANENDLPELLRLYGQLGQDDGSVLPLEDARCIFNRYKDYPSYRVHVAEMDGRMVGTFALLVMDNLGHMGASGGILEEVVVDNTLRGKGIGKKMMDYAHDLCRQYGCYKMTFSSNLKREDAHRFYASLGFKRHGYSFYIDYE
jgi:GNAT superfamily N-acetyltransferase